MGDVEESGLAPTENPASPTTLAPMVIFCSECRTIVGDSYSWLGADVTLRTITLYDTAESVLLKKELITSREGADVGSTFTEMECSNCNSFLGRVYKTTSRSLDHIRDMYSFSVDQVTLYQLGPNRNSVTEFDVRLEEMLDIPSIYNLQENMRKVQKVICHFHERLQPVERLLSQLKAGSLEVNHTQEASTSNHVSNVINESTEEIDDQSLQKDATQDNISLTDSPKSAISQHLVDQSSSIISSRSYNTRKNNKRSAPSINNSESELNSDSESSLLKLKNPKKTSKIYSLKAKNAN